MLRVVNSLLAVASISLLLVQPIAVLADDIEVQPANHLIITEVKIRNGYNALTNSGYDEYIELYNPTEDFVALGNYVLEYINASNVVDRKPVSQKMLAPSQSLVLEKPAVLPPRMPDSIPSPFANLTDGGGWLRLLDIEGIVVDEIGWTSNSGLATSVGVFPMVVYCSESNCKDKSMSRQLDPILNIYPAISASWIRDVPTPQSSQLLEQTEVNQDNDSENTSDQPDEPVVTCEGIIVSELLPNAAGSDTGKEFIELYNPTNEVISVSGCSLQIAGSGQTFVFTDANLQPGEYRTFSDSQTGLVLPNSAGGKVWLLSADDEELQEVLYPSGLDDDAAWALIDGVWQQTYQPTPAAINIAMLLKPCELGQERNTETGRCQNTAIVAVSALTPCKVGQERNAETGRCRNITAAVATLTPCKPGQERNPETNRCRNIATNGILAECPAGQERNPETNRCRKTTSDPQTLAAVKDVQSSHQSSGIRWWLAGSAVLMALGYGVYEWRYDIAGLLQKKQ